MDNLNILEQIINNQKAEEVARLNAIEIINNLFSELNERERDVLTRRFGLREDKKETLEAVGKMHDLTRERIRQIEVTSIKKLRELSKLEEYVSILKKVVSQLLEEHGGIMEKDYLFEVLTAFSKESDREKDEAVHKNNLDFLISKLLHQEFEETVNGPYFKSSYKYKFQELDHLEEVAEELLQKIKEANRVLKTEELIELIKNLEKYQVHKEKFEIQYNLDLAHVLRKEHFEEPIEAVNSNKTLYSLLKALKKIGQNKFGHWGLHDSREIKPKTINDKIYLILKQHGEPMHFVDIANKINEISFDQKKANPATVHNELILDDKYVLVGRGLYSLKEWGFKKGTVTDVIKEILEEVDRPISRDDIIEKVLAKRNVKKTTIVLALMNKDLFIRKDGGYVIKLSDSPTENMEVEDGQEIEPSQETELIQEEETENQEEEIAENLE